MPTTRYSVMQMLAAYDKEHPQTEGARPKIVVVEGDAAGAAGDDADDADDAAETED
jgi:hypothetical protein